MTSVQFAGFETAGFGALSSVSSSWGFPTTTRILWNLRDRRSRIVQ